MTRDLTEEVRLVRRMLSEAAHQLESPTSDSVAICADHLDKAIDRIVDLEVQARHLPLPAVKEMQEEMHGIRRELHTIGQLLAQAAQLQIGWARMIGAIPSSYDERGYVAEAGTSSIKVDL